MRNYIRYHREEEFFLVHVARSLFYKCLDVRIFVYDNKPHYLKCKFLYYFQNELADSHSF